MQYAKMPLEFLRDSRLSKNDLRVLAVLIFRSNKEGKCWPTLADISKLSGLQYSKISAHTSRLKNFGFIDKKLRKNGTNNLLIYTVFSQKSDLEVYPETVETIYPETVETIYPETVETIYPVLGETTPIIKHKTRNKEKSVVSAKRISVFSKAEILAVKIPDNLAQEKGFISAWESWVETKAIQTAKKNRFSDEKEVEKVLQNLSEWLDENFDIAEGLETAADRKWIGFRRQYFNLKDNQRKPKLTKSQEIAKAFSDLKGKNENNGIRIVGSNGNAGGDIPQFRGHRIHTPSLDHVTKRFLS